MFKTLLVPTVIGALAGAMMVIWLSQPTDDGAGCDNQVIPAKSSGLTSEAANPPEKSDRSALQMQVKPFSFYGKDDRTFLDPTTFPGTAVVQIGVPIPGYWYRKCTGWMYGPDIVATAGHCVFDTAGWIPNLQVRTDNGTVVPATWLFSTAEYVRTANEAFDYGAIKLAAPLGNTTGWLGYAVAGSSISGQTSNAVGWTQNVANCNNALSRIWVLCDGPGLIAALETRMIFYTSDVVMGQSGSPVFADGLTKPVIAIHSKGFEPFITGKNHKTYNHGPRITQEVFDNLYAWKAVKVTKPCAITSREFALAASPSSR